MDSLSLKAQDGKGDSTLKRKLTLLGNIFPLVAVMAAMGIAHGSPMDFVTGITGVDGSLPVVEGNFPTITGQTIVALGGDVKIYYAGYSSAADDLLLLGATTLINNETTALGSMFDLGNFAAGTVLTFTLENTTSGGAYVTGPASANPDNMVHVAYAAWTANSAIPVNGLFVGFEDLPASISDKDYDDLMAVLFGAAPSPLSPPPSSSTLEPSTSILFGSGLLGAAFLKQRRRRI